MNSAVGLTASARATGEIKMSVVVASVGVRISSLPGTEGGGIAGSAGPAARRWSGVVDGVG